MMTGAVYTDVFCNIATILGIEPYVLRKFSPKKYFLQMLPAVLYHKTLLDKTKLHEIRTPDAAVFQIQRIESLRKGDNSRMEIG